MSFYGSVYYQLVDAFNRIVFNNKGSKKTTFPVNPISQETTESAQGRASKIKIGTGNRWLSLTQDAEGDYSFWHTAPNNDAKNLISAAELVDENGDSIDVPTLKSKIKGSVIKYDEAGHVVGAAKNTVFDLHPRPSNMSNSTLTPFNTTEEVPGATELSPGEYIRITAFDYDDLGHLTTTSERIFKLPMSDTEKDISDVQEAIVDLQEADKGFEEIHTDLNDRLVETEKSIEDYDAKLGDYAKLKVKDDVGFFDTFGSVENIRSKVYDDPDSSKTISDAIIEIYTLLNNF